MLNENLRAGNQILINVFVQYFFLKSIVNSLTFVVNYPTT